MQNWIMNKVDVMRKMENAILGELETLLTDDGIMSAIIGLIILIIFLQQSQIVVMING